MELFINNRKGCNATATLKNETVTLHKGSVIAPTYSEQIPSKAKEARETAKIKNGVLQSDIAFSSASTAAAFVTGHVANGLTAWRTANGKKLKDVYAGKSRKGNKK